MKAKRQKAEGERRRQSIRLYSFAFCLFTFAFCVCALAQSGRSRSPASETKKSAPAKPSDAKPSEPPAQGTPQPTPPPAEDEEGAEAVRIETNLVTVPVVVSDREGRYVPDLKPEEFGVSEDGTEQKVSFFATVSEPFHVVLMLDTSASTTVEKLRLVQDAGIAFVEQLQPGDRVKVISFDDEVRDLCDFTGDRAALASAIRATRPGKGTRLYDAVDLALRALRRIRGRKAVVLFTDGVDWASERRTYDDNRKAVEESDVIFYPVRFDTREETERLARQQQRGGQTVDLGTILGNKIPGLPSVVVNPRGGGSSPRDDRSDPSRDAGRGGVGNDRPAPDATARYPEERGDASIAALMDRIYRLADDYLNEMARTSGGRLVRADTLGTLPRAFAQIAEELRTQYALGYYPTNAARDGKYRKIRVRSTRKGVVVRARPGYRASRAT
jgi:VWFA-related protein